MVPCNSEPGRHLECNHFLGDQFNLENIGDKIGSSMVLSDFKVRNIKSLLNCVCKLADPHSANKTIF